MQMSEECLPSGYKAVLNQCVYNCVQVTMEAGKYLVEQFVVQGLVAAVALPMTVMSAATLIDTWWAVCLDRAEKAGKLLAHVLMSGAHGDRYSTIHSSELLELG